MQAHTQQGTGWTEVPFLCGAECSFISRYTLPLCHSAVRHVILSWRPGSGR